MRRGVLTAGVLLLSTAIGQAAIVDHDLTVSLDPAAGTVAVVDRFEPVLAAEPDADGGYVFVLHGGLAPDVRTAGWALEPMPDAAAARFAGLNATSESTGDRVDIEAFRLVPGAEASPLVELVYGGVIRHDLATSGEEYQRSFSETPGYVGPEGVFLGGASYWVPTFGDGLMTFSLTITGLVPPWDVVSSGARVRHEMADDVRTTAWRMEHPTEEIYLVAGPWTEYRDRLGDIELYAFLREDDPALAARYLEAARRYLTMYDGILPAYPYAAFSVVENFWETGYGMPGFTLLGSRILRFPWILTSSFPHEILHDWWGNSVYVDYETGNWCEGLTAYMADHLFAEQRGEGASHRRATLQKFTDFVDSRSDVPLVEFGSRHSAASEAVGYGKSLMVHHMLRRAVGDDRFLAALGRFDQEHRFSRASWSDLADAFNLETGADWKSFVDTWTRRTGAPRLEIVTVLSQRVEDPVNPWRLQVALRQSQAEDPFPLAIPVAVTMAGRQEAEIYPVTTCGRRDCSLRVPLPAEPLRIDIDPEFDVMRRLDPLEVPPALSTVFGASSPFYVLPSKAPADELKAWRDLAAAWARPEEPRTILDSDIGELPSGAVWVLGATNDFADAVVGQLEGQALEKTTAGYDVAGESLPMAGHSIVMVARSTHDPGDAVGWIAADPVAAIPGLARKLPHYTRYSYLGFRGDEPENVLKGTWRSVESPLVRQLGDGPPVDLVLPARTPLAELPPMFDANRLAATAATLADPDLEGRGLGSPGLERATAWLEGKLEAAGLQPTGTDGYRDTWTWTGGDPEREMELVNLVARVPGRDPALAPVLVLAHLDHLGRGWPDVRAGNEGMVHPGADDNASGVAVALAVARSLANDPPRPRAVEFAFVTGEEAGLVGSRHLIAELGDDGRPFACLNLDTVGRLRDGKLYVLNADSAREWRYAFMGAGYTTGAPVEVVAEPLDASDQVACLEAGVPAVQLFTGPTADYHRPSDTVDTLDPDGMATVAEVTREIVGWLAERTEPLTVTLSAATGDSPTVPDGPRRAALGTVPDFAFAGPGVRVESVVPGSAAEAAGLLAGDVLVALDDVPLAGLRRYSEVLKTKSPGDRVRVVVLRDGHQVELFAVLGAR